MTSPDSTAHPRAADPGEQPATGAGPGARLRAAREAAGLSLGQVSSSLRLDQRIIDAIERGDYAALPAPTFVRGYLRAYARMLEVDPDPVVDDFDRCGLAPPSLVPDIGEGSQARSGDFPVRMVTYVIVAGLALMVALWWQNRESARTLLTATSVPVERDTGTAVQPDDTPSPEPVSGTTADAEPEPPTATGITGAETVPAETPTAIATGESAAGDGFATAAEAQRQAAPDAGIDSPPPVATGPTTAGGEATQTPAPGTPLIPTPATDAATQTADPGTPPVPTPATEAAVDAEQPATGVADTGNAASVAATGEPATGDRLTLSLGHDSWIEVYDAAGAKLYFNLAKEGTELELRGTSPFRVLLGYARDIGVRFNGVEFDPAPYSARGIARFVLGGPATPSDPGELEASAPPATR